MKTKNPLVEMPEPINVPVTKKKEFNINKAVGITLLSALFIFTTVFTAMAMFKDPIKETETKLEQSLSKHSLAWNHQKSMINDTRALLKEQEEQLGLMADLYCEAWKALKSFRIISGIPLVDPTTNVCREIKAPQEVGYQPEIAPGAEGQILPDPTFQ